MKNHVLRAANYFIAAINLLTAAVAYPFLPDQIPMHWDFSGTVSYDDKYQIFLMCGMAVLFAFFLDVLPKIDPRKKNYQKFERYYDGFCVFMQIFLMVMNYIILIESFRPGTLSVPVIIMLGIGILFVFVGNMMPKLKSNFYMGIKTPWALSSEEVWRKTHRLGGKCFFLAGLLLIAGAFFSNRQIVYYMLFACIMIASIVPSVMSYVWWRQEQK